MSSPVSAKPKHKKKSKDKEKSKGKDKDKEAASAHGRNEGVDPNWAYEPPAGMVTLDTTHMDDAYDWEAVKNDDDKELWIVRVPEGFKVKQLEGLQIQQPRDAPAARLTTLERKRAKYDVWAVDPNRADAPEDDAARPPRGEEITTVSCLLPRKKKGGKLYISPKPISQHLIVTHSPATPQVDAASAPSPSRRHRVPKHLLTHTFLPYGATTSDDNVVHASDAMDVDAAKAKGDNELVEGDPVVSPSQEPRTPKQKKALSTPQTSPSKTKKRKNVAGEESPKRSKKVKI